MLLPGLRHLNIGLLRVNELAVHLTTDTIQMLPNSFRV